jgi:hypothetical protein
MTRHTLLVILFTHVVVTLCSAGVTFDFHCENPDCRYTGGFSLGGGFSFDSVAGYCTHCRDFVSLSWRSADWKPQSGEMPKEEIVSYENRPRPLGTVWNAATGRDDDIYACPRCKSPFAVIDPFAFAAAVEKLVDVLDAQSRQADAATQPPNHKRVLRAMEMMREGAAICPRCKQARWHVKQSGHYD